MKQKEENKKVDYSDVVDVIAKHPLIRAVLIGGAVIGLIFVSGIVMKAIPKALHIIRICEKQ
jgi:hypothetical protein